MSSSLRDIPGANRSRPRGRRRRRERDLWAAPRRTTLDFGPRPLSSLEQRRDYRLRPRGQPDWGLVAVWVVGLAVVGWLALEGWNATRVRVTQRGIDDGMVITAAEAEQVAVEVTMESDGDLSRATVSFDSTAILTDGEPVVSDESESADDEVLAAPSVDGTLIRWRPGPQPEGEHELTVTVPRAVLPDATFAWSFTVDDTAPRLVLPVTLDPAPIDEELTIEGSADDDATVTWAHGDGELEVLDDDGGDFSLDFEHPPAGPVIFEATDEAGNVTRRSVMAPVEYPSDLRAVHVTAAAWGHKPSREAVIGLVDSGRINAVELDLKDEAGTVGYDSQVRRAEQIGAVRPGYDLRDAVDFLHERGVHVIGRIVAFRDPVLAEFAWTHDQRDQVIQTPGGKPFAAYGGFTNYTHPDVRQYNIDLAIEAVEAGVDDILYDYVRRPDGNPSTMHVPGRTVPSTEAVNAFLALSHHELRSRGAVQGASVFGIAADRPDAIGQHVPTMARHVDYIAPMLYPSHWVDGEYRVASPIRQPYEIVKASLADFQRVAKDTGVRFTPWLQDFSLYGVTYGPAQVRAQIDAAAELGVDRFLLWNPIVRYQAAALDPRYSHDG